MGDISHEFPDLLTEDTSTYNRGGAVQWLAPELFEMDDGDDPKVRPLLTKETDIYSYGMVMIEVVWLFLLVHFRFLAAHTVISAGIHWRSAVWIHLEQSCTAAENHQGTHSGSAWPGCV